MFSIQHAHIVYASASSQQYVLKLVNIADALSIIKQLHSESAVYNHIIPILRFYPTDLGTIISMPSYTPLNHCGKFSVTTAADLCQQLLIALRYLHSRNIVHRDLKPENVVIDLEGDAPHLFIIDFSLAAYVEGRDDYFTDGPVGTEGFTAPEAGFENKYNKETTHSPMAADLWAAGSLMDHMLMSSQDYHAAELGILWEIAYLLMDKDPTQRPSAEDAIAQLSLKETHH